MGNTFTLLIIFIVKSLQKEQNCTNYYYDPQSAGINMQSPQSESTPRRLTIRSSYWTPKVIFKAVLSGVNLSTLPW